MKLYGYIVYHMFQNVLLLLLIYAFFKLTFCHGKWGVSCKIAIFINISFSFGQFHETSGLYCFLKVSTCALVIFKLCLVQVDVLSWKKGCFVQNCNVYSNLFQFWSKFYKTSWLYCLFKVSPCVFAFLCTPYSI